MQNKPYFFFSHKHGVPKQGEGGGSPTWEKFPHFPIFFWQTSLMMKIHEHDAYDDDGWKSNQAKVWPTVLTKILLACLLLIAHELFVWEHTEHFAIAQSVLSVVQNMSDNSNGDRKCFTIQLKSFTRTSVFHPKVRSKRPEEQRSEDGRTVVYIYISPTFPTSSSSSSSSEDERTVVYL